MKFITDLSRGRIYGLDVIRAIAIVAVVIYHWPKTQSQTIFRAVSHFGFHGVDLFFVLSGYLIAGQSFRLIKTNQFKIKHFYRNRLMRTLPNYYFILILSIILFGSDKFDWRYIFFLQNFGDLFTMTHTWSLCIEEHFYFLFPLVLLFLMKTNNLSKIPLGVVAIMILEIIIRYLTWSKYRPDLAYALDVEKGYAIYFKQLFYPTYARLDGLSLGVLIAYIHNFKKELWNKLLEKANTILLGSVLLLMFLSYFIYNKTQIFNAVIGYTTVSFCMFGLVISSLSQQSLIQKIKVPGITLISILSYSIYLTHGFAFEASFALIKILNFDSHGFFQNLLNSIFIILFAAILYWGVEKPILRLRDRKLS